MNRFLLCFLIILICQTAPGQGVGGNGVPGAGSGGASIPATSNVLKGTGSAGAATAATPGTDFITPSPSGSQTINQPGSTQLHLNNVTVYDGAQIDTLAAAKINTVIYVDGITAAGVGQAPVSWVSGTQYSQCQEVSHSGGNYLEITEAGDNSTTPGTNSQIWYPLTNGSIPTQLDCAFYLAAASILSGTGTVANSGLGAAIVLGANSPYYTNIGLTEPTVSSPGQAVVNIYGQGRSQTTIKQGTAKADGFPTLYQPPTLTPYAFASFNWRGFTVDSNYVASAVVGIYGAQQFTMEDMILADATDGSDHYIEFGNYSDTAHGWVFEPHIDNVDLGTNRGFGTGAVVSTTVTGGIPSFTITNGGSGYSSADTQVILGGTSDFGRACSNAGTTTATINGSGVITGITSTASGCVSPVYTIVYGGPNINYGYKFSNVTDGKQISNMTNGGVGWIAGMYLSPTTGALKIYNYHPEAVLQGVLEEGSADFYSLQCDTVFQYCANIQGAGTVNFHSPFFEWNNPNMTGSRDYYFLAPGGGIPGYSEPQAVNIENETCGNIPQQPGYAHFDSSAGVIDSNVGSEVSALPVYVHAVHPAYCSQIGNGFSVQNANPTLVGQNIQMADGAIGNVWNYNLGAGPLNGGSQTMTVTQANSAGTALLGSYTWDFDNATASTGSNNYNSPTLDLEGTYWSGSGSTAFGVGQQLSFASGSNPAATYTFSGNLGSAPSGGLTFQFNSPTDFTSGLYGGSSNQFHVDNVGNVTTSANVTAAKAITAPAFSPQSGAAGPYSSFFDDFYTGANMASDPIGSPTGDSCSPNDTYTDVNHPGNMLLTAGTGGSGTGIVCGLVSENPSITSANTSLGWTWETAVYVPVLPGTTAGAYQAGMAHTPNANPWTTGIGFYLSSANGTPNDWYCQYNSTSTDSTVAATVAWTRLTMVNDGTNVHWYIGGTQVCGTGVAIASMPSTTQYPAVWSATALSATSVTMAYDYINWQRAVVR